MDDKNLFKGFLKLLADIVTFVLTVKKTCKVMNFDLSRSSFTHIGCVTVLQSLTQSPHRTEVHAGVSLELRCRRGISVPPPVILWWYHTSSEVGNRHVVQPNERVVIGVDGKL